MALMNIPKVIRFVYALITIGVLAYLSYSRHWQLSFGWLLLLVSAALGFRIFSPVVPYQFQQFVLGVSLFVGAASLTVVFFRTFAFGRFFCGYLCPVGAVQEIVFMHWFPSSDSVRKTCSL